MSTKRIVAVTLLAILISPHPDVYDQITNLLTREYQGSNHLRASSIENPANILPQNPANKSKKPTSGRTFVFLLLIFALCPLCPPLGPAAGKKRFSFSRRVSLRCDILAVVF
jgi:hypothetical protein